MAFFARFPEAVRYLGLRWKAAPTTATPVVSGALSASPLCSGIVGRQQVAVAPARGQAPKLKTICMESRAVQRSKSVRVVISGRMADVCAELDRLVALEAQPTLH